MWWLLRVRGTNRDRERKTGGWRKGQGEWGAGGLRGGQTKNGEGEKVREERKEIFYLRLYCVTHMVKDHSDKEKGNPLPPHGLLFPISSKGSFIYHSTDRITHTTAFVTPVVEHWLEWEIAQWVHHEGSIRRPIAPWVNALTMELHLVSIDSERDRQWEKKQKIDRKGERQTDRDRDTDRHTDRDRETDRLGGRKRERPAVYSWRLKSSRRVRW